MFILQSALDGKKTTNERKEKTLKASLNIFLLTNRIFISSQE